MLITDRDYFCKTFIQMCDANIFPLELFKFCKSLNKDKFETSISLSPGTYTYKYVIDNTQWVISPEVPSANDGTGVINNIVNVLPPPSVADDE